MRRNARAGVIVLPAEGRKGRAPKWPLPPNPKLTARIELLAEEVDALEERDLDDGLSRAERTKLSRLRERLRTAELEAKIQVDTETELWRKLWRTPQACEWERYHWIHEVAQYVRHQAAAELGHLEHSREARLRAEGLGLTPKGMRSLLWTIAVDEVAQQRDEQRTSGDRLDERRRRLRLAAVDHAEQDASQ